MRLCTGLPGVQLATLSRLSATSRTRDNLNLFDCRTVAHYPRGSSGVKFVDQLAVDLLRMARRARERLELFASRRTIARIWITVHFVRQPTLKQKPDVFSEDHPSIGHLPR
jgi:hypothetical protein